MLKTTLLYEQPDDYYDIFSHMVTLKERASIREFINKTERSARAYRGEVSQQAEAAEFSSNDDKQLFIRNKINKYKGDLLEIFSELFFKAYEADPAVGVKDYTPISITDDYGVDATGVNVNGCKVAIQVKYRSNPKSRISYASVAKTFTSAVCQYGINPMQDNIIYVLTTAQGCQFPPEKILGNKLMTISRENIANKVDGNLIFWDNAYRSVYEALDGD